MSPESIASREAAVSVGTYSTMLAPTTTVAPHREDACGLVCFQQPTGGAELCEQLSVAPHSGLGASGGAIHDVLR